MGATKQGTSAMKWISAGDLNHWADTHPARDQLSALVADLARASVPTIHHIRFPSGDQSGVRGFDGTLFADVKSSPYVPDGESIWELSAQKDYKGKADDEYKRVTEATPKEVRERTHFVFATLRTWNKTHPDDLHTWTTEKNNKRDWLSVRCIDGVQLEAWLETAPAVAERFAKQELPHPMPPGAYGIDTFWREFSSKYDPPLDECVVLAGREKQAEEFLRSLQIKGDPLKYAADSSDEVIAFAVCAIRTAKEHVRYFLESKALIVTSPDAARQLSSVPGLIFFPMGAAREQAAYLQTFGPTLLTAGAKDRGNAFVKLERPSKPQLQEALMKMSIPPDRAAFLAHTSARSLTILSRQMPGPATKEPEWCQHHVDLMPVMLAGAWSYDSEKDKKVVSALKGATRYEEVERPLRALLNIEDSPIEFIDEIRAIRSSVDAYSHLEHHLGDEHLELLSAALQDVFSEEYKPFNPDEIFSTTRESRDASSITLREGLLTTLLHMAVLPRKNSSIGQNFQSFVNRCVASFPGISDDHRFMSSLGNNLALLAEASPDSFLQALETILEGVPEKITPIFHESESFFAQTSPHVAYLWALETLAWDPAYLSRAVFCLARLAEHDPGGKLQNRPINSLREIFLPWTRNTNATTQVKLATLKQLLREVPSVAWRLLSKLLPSHHDVSTPTAKPKFREGDFRADERITNQLVWNARAEIVGLALEHVGAQADRWELIAERLGAFPPKSRVTALERLDAFMRDAEPEARQVIWEKLKRVHSHHAGFPDADWSFDAETLKTVGEIVSRYEPRDPLKVASFMFENWDDDAVEDAAALKARREGVVRKIYKDDDLEGLVKLLEASRLYTRVFECIELLRLTKPKFAKLAALLRHSPAEKLNWMSASMVYMAHKAHGEAWLSYFKSFVAKHRWSDEDIAESILSLGSNKRELEYVASFGSEIEAHYWKSKPAMLLDDRAEEAPEIVAKFLSVGHALAALQSVNRRLDCIPTGLIQALLLAAIPEINAKANGDSTMSTYLVDKAFQALYQREDAKDDDVVALEMAYLMMWAHDQRQKDRRVHRKLLRDPAFFIEVILAVYRRDDEPERETTESDGKRAKLCWHLLESIQSIPGYCDGAVDATVLKEWVLKAREIAVAERVVNITDSYIGKVLAHAPSAQGDDAWPHEAVRQVLEECRSEKIEAGIQTGRFNMRGATWRDPHAGGVQERGLAQQHRDWAALTGAHPRTREMLLAIAKSWDEMARQEDLEAEKRARK